MTTRYLVLDTETTGLEPRQGHKIIEIGCVELIERRLTGNNYQQFLNPEREIDAGALEVHGIELSELEDKPTFGQIADDFLSYIRGATLVIHNAAFDVGFLDHELGLLERDLGSISDYCEVIDTLLIARKKHPGQRNSLDALCQRYFISNEHRSLHGALLDSEILAEVYLSMTGGQLSMLGEQQDQSIEGSHEDAGVIKFAADRKLTKIIPASEEELSGHEQWMKLLSENKHEKVSG
jgi:DNA polymerase-3 subunit epsilon